jgi:hypothetical protein
LQPSGTIPNIPEPCPTLGVTEDDNTVSDFEDDEEVNENGPWTHTPALAGQFTPPPTVEEATLALADLKLILRPPRNSGRGHKDPKLDLLLRTRLERMQMFLWNYTDPANKGCGWMAASLKTAHAQEKGPWLAGRLREWVRAYCKDREDLPMNIYGTWSSSILEDEDFAQELLLHLQGIGKYVKAMDIVEYLDRAEVKSRLKLTKTISLSTAQRWMSHVGYRWSKTPTGQFVDGHERIDVVEYRQAVFLPIWAEMLSRTRIYTIDGNEGAPPPSSTQARRVVIWNHDEQCEVTGCHRMSQKCHVM